MIRVCTLGLTAFALLAVPLAVQAEVGVCCFADGSCTMMEEEDCWAVGGCAFIPGAD